MTHLKLDGVTKRYSDVVAVDDVNLDIEDGEFVSLIGPSGCGKSTTLETVSGLTKPTSGLIEIAGTDVTNKPPKDRNIAMVFQNIALFPHMSVRENMTFGLRLKNYRESEIDERVERAADILQINGMLDRMPDELSGGQRQRVAIGRAIVLDPEVFLMDEPLANLDAKLKVHMRTELQRLQQELGVTTVYVTHDQEEAMTLSDRIAIINDGRLQQFAPPLRCYNEPANLFVAGFVGSPSMRFVDGRIDGGSFAAPGLGIDVDLPPSVSIDDGDDVILGIRPEDVYLDAHRTTATATDVVTLEVDVVQPMGDELVVYLRPEGTNVAFEADLDEGEPADTQTDQLLMTVEPTIDIEAGETVDVALDRAQIHLFDATTGDALTHGLEPRVERASN
ncbi:ABC transporter ATP-binding protein [Halomicroarcula limicola]|uniref:ABC-type D-xylose/L-arabinose transporter n=1 Tax=Haloarcula limicola TaxID=1429915 RepID=A0A8J7YGA0_9EURY|nr:ABC transporter ATP-binding protein [Halomicroarcula limicola]MBV0925943.1 ABC transporter ATP-binding protein [Halomicroarcula limicola]